MLIDVGAVGTVGTRALKWVGWEKPKMATAPFQTPGLLTLESTVSDLVETESSEHAEEM